ncbi:DUF2809 domain-containing protein [Flavobacterium sp. DG1-102-2]|uniref:ribosomal maturation YjgA family protein n=1 Tax=Flavobacterium sp. DG1-102-2 TaxID=3081663 RepID=UPI00294A92F0|nr:DUF2809 domain-containing protein [Flavobacterium sp. DG1-102-2]MDV6167348.1 DUF2809 domain-containing protein [Flavobacterium sp. DG1-102-2]
MKKRIIYCIIIIITIALGLFVRVKRQWFPDIVNLYLGDILYAFMMYYIISFITIENVIRYRAILALAVCFCIEFLQLYRADWINSIRGTFPGRLVLGSGFLWSDLLAYTIGVSVAFIFEKFMLFKPTTAR